MGLVVVYRFLGCRLLMRNGRIVILIQTVRVRLRPLVRRRRDLGAPRKRLKKRGGLMGKPGSLRVRLA